MPSPNPFAFSIGPRPDAGWWWRAVRRDGHIAEGEAPTRAAAAAFVIRIFASEHRDGGPIPDPAG